MMLRHRLKSVKPEPVLRLSNKQKSLVFIRGCNFYKLFWVFLIGSVFGCYMEQFGYYSFCGIWESRAGVIWGSFSEIYGFGAVLVYAILRKIKSPIIIFVTAMLCGAAFEYAAGLFQELAFGSQSWNYSNEEWNIGGKTCLKYAFFWGLLGFAFVRWIFPGMDHLLEKIKGRAALTATWTLLIFMVLNLLFSSLAVERWNERLRGLPSNGLLNIILDQYYGNEEMEKIYPHMNFF